MFGFSGTEISKANLLQMAAYSYTHVRRHLIVQLLIVWFEEL
jgi:hypothetical protein